VSYACVICQKASRGFGWQQPSGDRAIVNKTPSVLDKTRYTFCSKVCQDIFFELWKEDVIVIKTDVEQQAINAVLSPLGDYVCTVGMDKPLSHYSKEQILGLINTVLDSYQCALQERYKNEVPF
jgi:endogenous inhibitor of DNA gyrase (YacG/DUF329 family)